MYLSHPVRRIRDDPTAETEIGLVVELGDADRDALVEAVTDAGGEVREDLRFGAFHVVVPEVGVDDLCELDGVERIETDATITSSSEPIIGGSVAESPEEPVEESDNR